MNTINTKFNKKLIAPCGINCRVCKAYLRKNNPCPGCSIIDNNTPVTRLNCLIRICEKRKGKFCFSCPEFACDRLKNLDKRYRTKYGMSEIDNLEYIGKNGINKFLQNEERKWISEKGILCVHDRKYYK